MALEIQEELLVGLPQVQRMTRLTLHVRGAGPDQRVELDVDQAPPKVADVLMQDVRRWRLTGADGRIVIANPAHVAWADLEALPEPDDRRQGFA